MAGDGWLVGQLGSWAVPTAVFGLSVFFPVNSLLSCITQWLVFHFFYFLYIMGSNVFRLLASYMRRAYPYYCE